MNIKKAIVIGNGSIASCHRKNLKILFPKLFIVSVPASGRILNKDIEFADDIILDLNDAIKKKADIAIVASPSPYHAMHTKLLLKAGIPSLIEKPVTNNSQDARELIKIQSETGIPVSIGYCLRYLPSSIKMKELIEACRHAFTTRYRVE